MNKIRIAVVEDEPIVAMDIMSNLQQMEYEVLGPFDRGEELIKLVKSDPPDIALLDIEIEGNLDGIETAEVINEIADLPIIFITASSDKFTKERAKNVQPYAYIIKPFNFHNLHSAIDLALHNFCHADTEFSQDKLEHLQASDAYPGYHTIFVRKTNAKRFEKLPLDKVVLLEAEGSYTKIITTDDCLTICCNLQKILDKISLKHFIRVHRSYAININNIQSITEEELTVGNINVPISKGYRTALFKQLNLL